MSKTWLVYLFCLASYFYFPQAGTGLAWPIDTPHVIVGNYGELRSSHFHAGWDFSTHGKINFPVYVVADGYVSRIKISATGYGKAVYITHPDNTVSVYAHLNVYAGNIAELVKKEQLARQSYELELFPAKDLLKVRKGETIGYSGNSGSSTGPHLHFEVRNQLEVPLNPSGFLSLADTVKPVIQQLAFYSLADTNQPVFIHPIKIKANKKDSLFPEKDSVTFNQPLLGVAFAGFDQSLRKGNANVIYSAKLYFDGLLIYHYTLNTIAFDEQRYVNEFAETIQKVKYQKCFLPTLYPASLYSSSFNKGRIALTDTNYHLLKLTVSDERMNERSVELHFRTNKTENFIISPDPAGTRVDCRKIFDQSVSHVRLIIPAKTLYRSSSMVAENDLETTGRLAILPEINLKSPVKIGFIVPKKLAAHPGKLILKNGSAIYLPAIKNDSLVYAVNTFGHFQLETDTVAPKMKTQLTPKKIRRLKKINVFSFIITDPLSGIGKYRLLLNGSWVLAEYDAKNSLLSYFFDETTPVGPLTFKVEAEDKVGNRSEFKYVLKH